MIAAMNTSAKANATVRVAWAKSLIEGMRAFVFLTMAISMLSMAEGAASAGSSHWNSSWVACFITVAFLMFITLLPSAPLGVKGRRLSVPV